MTRLLALLAPCLLPAPVAAQASPFDVLTGTFGASYLLEESCRKNPHTVRFTDGQSRARFDWQTPIMGYDDQPRSHSEYTVVGLDGDGIIMALDGESRITASGAPVVWILRPVQRPDGYCWGRTDWPAARCIALHLRCPGGAPTS